MSAASTTLPSPAVRPALTALRRRLHRRHVVWLVVCAVGALAAGAGLADGLDRIGQLREGWAFVLCACVGTLALVVLCAHLLRSLLRPVSPERLALQIERVRPEFLDSLICAAELERRDPSDLRPLERELVRRVAAGTAGQEFLEDVLPSRLTWSRLLLLGGLFSAALAVGMRSPAMRKALYYAGDMIRGSHTGLVLRYPSDPVPEHRDVRIDVDVRRWEPEASIQVEDASGTHRYAMHRGAGSASFFTLYDVTGTVRFRITTPSLASAWREVATYSPPAFESVAMTLTPPAYTRREPLAFEAFTDCTIVEGSRLDVRVTSAPGVTATRVVGQERDAMPGGAHSSVVTQDLAFRVDLMSPDGWPAAGPETLVRVEPDLSPVVDVLAPRGDVPVLPDGRLNLEARATDDFGIATVEILYTVSGGERQRLRLYPAGGDAPTAPEADVTARHRWDIAEMGLQPGDLVSYVVTAEDNREPNPQTGRSDVLFIVVRPDLSQDEQEGDGQQQEKKVDIGPLIAECKRLIRLTWDTLALEGAERRELEGDLVNGMKELELATRRVFNEILEAAQGQAGGPVIDLFQAADREMLAAVAVLSRRLPEESLPHQERALTALVALENELLKNAAKSRSQSDSDSQQAQQPEDQVEADRDETRRERLRRLQDALEQLTRLSERQERLTADVARLPADADEGRRDGLSRRQDDVRTDTRALEDGLKDLAEAARAVRDTEQARREMSAAATALRGSLVRTAEQRAARAQGALAAATASLQEAIRQTSAGEIARLARQAQELAAAQRQESAQSRTLENTPGNRREQAREARARQEALNRREDALARDATEIAQSLQETYPEAAESVAQATQSAAAAGLDRHQKKALNALLYQRFERAAREQTNAANLMQQMAADLEQAVGKLPMMSRDELVEAMRRQQERAARAAEEGENPGEESEQRLGRIRRDAARDLGQLASALHDRDLRQLADEMSLPMGGETLGGDARRLAALLRASAEVLEAHLMRAERSRRVGLSRQLAVPPEKYRRLVERYFKDLSRDR